MEEAARGCVLVDNLRTVTLPMLVPGFAASFLLLFVEAIADLANPLVIGGDFTVLASRAYIAVNGEYKYSCGPWHTIDPSGPLRSSSCSATGQDASTVTVTGKPARSVCLPMKAHPAGNATFLLAAFVVTYLRNGYCRSLHLDLGRG